MDYTNLQSTAKRLITKFGTTCTVETVNGESFSGKIVFLPATTTDEPSTYALDYDVQAYMATTKVQPLPGDQITTKDGKVSAVVRSQAFAPGAGLNLYWELELKS